MSRPDEPGGTDADSESPGFQGPESRAQLRAALALEEAGELQEAARLFEYVGEHSQASALRVEFAKTLRDEQQRLAVLREGASRNRGNTDMGAVLHRSLARSLLVHVEGLEDGARRRGLLVEAAQALSEAGEDGEAGTIYESLGMLTRAAKAYELAGEISKLEYVFTVLERREQAAQAQRQLERDVESAWSEGQRRLAKTLVDEHVFDCEQSGRSPVLALTRRLADLQRTLPRPGRLHLRVQSESEPDGVVTLHVHLGTRLRVGRAPQNELRVTGQALSREHVIFEAGTDEEGRPSICAVDQGTPAGSFLDGEALVPGEPSPIELKGELGLGYSTALNVSPILAPSSAGSASGGGVLGVMVGRGDGEWAVFLPHGGPLCTGPGQPLAVTVENNRDFITLRGTDGAGLWLGDLALGSEAAVEVLVGDRVALESADSSRINFEVLG